MSRRRQARVDYAVHERDSLIRALAVLGGQYAALEQRHVELEAEAAELESDRIMRTLGDRKPTVRLTFEDGSARELVPTESLDIVGPATVVAL